MSRTKANDGNNRPPFMDRDGDAERPDDQPLPGEPASARSGDALDARRWFEVYGELCGFKETILNDLVGQRTHVRPEGRAEIDHDEQMLREEYDRLRRRLDYWEREYESRGR